MTSEPNKRPRRNPLTSEEVSNIIAHRKKKELLELRRFKKSKLFKLLNVFNVACFFIFLEILFCYFGPCHYTDYYAVKTKIHYGPGRAVDNKLFVSEVDLYNSPRTYFKLVVDDCIAAPANTLHFIIGRDFLLQINLKGYIEGYDREYRLFSASPVLFLSFLASCFSFFVFVMNLNEKSHNLAGLSCLNFLVLLGILLL